MAGSPQYTNRVISTVVQATVANTARDGTGTLATAYTFTAAASGGLGGRIDFINIQATGTTTAGVVRLFISHDGGTSKRLVSEYLVTAVTPSTTVKVWQIPTSAGADVNGRLPLGMLCLPGDIIYFATNNAETFNCHVEGGEF